MTGTSPAPAAMERLAIPEDDTAPYTPFEVVVEGELEALDPDGTRRADLLSLSQL